MTTNTNERTFSAIEILTANSDLDVDFDVDFDITANELKEYTLGDIRDRLESLNQ